MCRTWIGTFDIVVGSVARFARCSVSLAWAVGGGTRIIGFVGLEGALAEREAIIDGRRVCFPGG